MDGLGKAAVVGEEQSQFCHGYKDQPTETDLFVARFCSEHGQTLKVCPDRWVVGDGSMGVWLDKAD